MHVAISGSTGFLGGHLHARAVELGHEVSIIDRHTMPCNLPETLCGFVGAEVLEEQFQNASIDAVILAGAADTRESGVEAVDHLVQGNVLLNARLLAAASRAGVGRAILIGTSWQEASGSGFEPWDLYAASKQAGHSMAMHFARCGMDVSELHLFDTYGPNDPRRKVYNLMLDAALAAEPIGLSPGEQRIHMVHIADACNAILGLLQEPLHEGMRQFRVDSDQSVSIKEIASIISELEPAFQPEFGARPYRPNEIMNPASRHPRPAGWQPSIDLWEGIRACLLAKQA